MKITTRAGWGARPAKAVTHVDPSARRLFVVHHSGGPVTQSVRAIQDWCMGDPPHRGRGFSDIDYNFLVRGDSGQVYEGRGWDVVGAHTAGHNTAGVGVCIIGTDQASAAAKRSVRQLHELYNKRCGRRLTPRSHRDLATTGTDCPGDHIHAWVSAGMPAPPQEDTMTKAEITAGVIAALNSAEGRAALATGLDTVQASLRNIDDKASKLQVGVTNVGRAVAALAGTDLTDEQAIITGVLAGLDPAAIAAAIPDELAEKVAENLAARLAA